MSKYLFLGMILVVVGCSDSVSDEPDPVQYPMTVGTWEITSPTRADWRGDAYMVQNEVAKAGSDTVRVTEPEGQGLTLWVEEEKRPLLAQDVMFTYEGPAGSLEDEPVVGGSIVFSDSSAIDRGISYGPGTDDFEVIDGRLYTELSFGFKCNAAASEKSEVTITLLQGDRHDPTARQVYIFNTYGMTDVIKHLYCPHH